MKVAELFEKDDDEHIDKMMKDYDPGERVSITVDWADDSIDYDNEKELEAAIKKSVEKSADHEVKDLKIKVLKLHGSAGGWPEVEFTGGKKELRALLIRVGFAEDEGEIEELYPELA